MPLDRWNSKNRHIWWVKQQNQCKEVRFTISKCKGGTAKGVFKGGLSFYDKYDSKDGQSHIKYVIDNIEKDFKTYNSDNQVGDIRKQAGEM